MTFPGPDVVARPDLNRKVVNDRHTGKPFSETKRLEIKEVVILGKT